MSSDNQYLNLNGRLFDLSEPVVMGILNVTPDSFYSGNRFTGDKTIAHAAEKIVADGAKIIDVGGYSTRPNAEEITVDEEIRRVSNALEIVRKRFGDVPVSVDTFRSAVVRHVVRNYGVEVINDISGGALDPLMFETVADMKVAYVLMHSRGNPKTMQSLTGYDELVPEVLMFLNKRIGQLRLLGVNDIIVDPGFGFAKTTEQNYTLLRKLPYFSELDVPLLAGVSRKSMVCKVLECTPEEALNGTTAVHMLALMGGASILRVHDVKEAVETIKIYNAFIVG